MSTSAWVPGPTWQPGVSIEQESLAVVKSRVELLPSIGLWAKSWSKSLICKYHDTYTEDVKKLIEDKAKGQKRQTPPPKPPRSSNVIDLVAALQESLAQKKSR